MATYKYSMRALLFGNGRSRKANKERAIKLEKKYNSMPSVEEIRKFRRVKKRVSSTEKHKAVI